MAGIYIHIPFCKQACYYCDFHFSTSLRRKPEMLHALKQELLLRKDYLPAKDSIIQTIYFGGGTPSLLSSGEIKELLDVIYRHYVVAETPEITLEANPDDLSSEKLKELRNSPINRLSIGIQSFYEEDLIWMHRAHNAEEAKTVLGKALDVGFMDLTADLIFGYPLLTDDKWEANLSYLLDSGIQHFSAYSMTVEPGTPLGGFIKRGQQKPMDEEQSARQYLSLMDRIEKEIGWEQYEISNYAKEGHFSRHNTNYWRRVPYLGIGPSAHSYDGESRQWNTRVNARYIEGLKEGQLSFKREVLTPENKADEYLMTALRTKWGIDLDYVQENFGPRLYRSLIRKSETFIARDQLIKEDSKMKLSTKGKLFADYIAAELFV